MHYCKLRYAGKLSLKPKPTLDQRFWNRVDASRDQDDCWPWVGTCNRYGYGEFRIEGRVRKAAHRIAYELATGEEIGELQIDHICHNRACCNPKHLRLATNKQNCENLAGLQRNNHSGVRGVRKEGRRWLAQVTHNYQIMHLGTFDSLEEAAAVVLAKRLELFTHSDMDKRAAS